MAWCSPGLRRSATGSMSAATCPAISMPRRRRASRRASAFPVKVMREDVLQQDIVDILAANSRVPLSNWGDLNGQLNALDLGERRLNALLDEHGEGTIA